MTGRAGDLSGDILETLLSMERRVWGALVTGDASADRALLSPDFLGVYPTGFAGRYDHAGQLDAGPTVAEVDLCDARVLLPGPQLGLLCYRARFRRTGAAVWEVMYVSSLWRETSGGWVNLFSQDTPEGSALP